jgi:hypothetical protein
MTEQEALKLKPGDKVEVHQCQGGRNHQWKWKVATFLGLDLLHSSNFTLRVLKYRIDGLTAKGREKPIRQAVAMYFRRIPNHNPVSANVYADYIDEHGEHKAAALLREAFPLAGG